jgi:hypothetical protein
MRPEAGADTNVGGGSAAELQAEFDLLANELELALSLAAQGQMLELTGADGTGIDGRIAAACRAVQALPAPEAQAMVDRLGHLVALLDRLAAELVHNFGDLPQEPDPRAAAEAYGKGSGARD